MCKIKIVVFVFISFFYENKVNCQIYQTITDCDTLLIDTSLFKNQVGTCHLTINSGNNNNIAYSVEYFDANYGDIFIYDGINSSGTQLSFLTHSFNLPNQILASRSNSNAITIVFGKQSNNPNIHFKIVVKCVKDEYSSINIQPLKSYNFSGNIKKADYDNDGDYDLIIDGRILRNDSYFDSAYKFERKSNIIDNWTDINLCSGDFDNDGFKDIFITGTSSVFGGIYGARTAIYKNTGNDSFVLVNTNSFINATRGGCSVIDFNGDGLLDICYTGSQHFNNNNNLIFKIYINNGNMSFTDANISLPGINGLINSTISWADSEGDGDNDLLINGHNGVNNITGFYLRNGNTFVKDNLYLTATSSGKIEWVDINQDNKPDIVNSGVTLPNHIIPISPQILINNGNNSFSPLLNNIPARAFGGMDWIDYDNDNDKDLVLGGVITNSGSNTDIGIYKNNGSGNFIKVSSLNNVEGASLLKWIDFDKDGKLDVMGGGYFLKNLGMDSFKIASFKFPHYSRQLNNATFEDFNNDGYQDVFIAGLDIVDVDCNINYNSTLVVGKGWHKTAVPNFTQVANVSTLNPINLYNGYYTEPYYSWADFDSDGLLDIVMTGDNNTDNAQNFLVVYKNVGNNIFSLHFNSRTTPLPTIPYQMFPLMRSVGFFDIDTME